MTTMTYEEINALTMADVDRVKAKVARNAMLPPEERDRSGLTTIEYVLFGVDPTRKGYTLAEAKAALRSKL